MADLSKKDYELLGQQFEFKAYQADTAEVEDRIIEQDRIKEKMNGLRSSKESQAQQE